MTIEFPSDVDIARGAKLKDIIEIAALLDLGGDDLDVYGSHKAKIRLKALEKADLREPGNLILVSAMTPTPAGEGKTTTSIGLTQGLAALGKSVCCAIRQPSLGPVFGRKGGATGGGYSQLVPMEDINLHFTGDFHAVTAAHNLLAAAIDNHLYWKDVSGLDPRTVTFRRVLDVNDRALRDIVIGLGGRTQGVPRETGFDITAASEVMAILALSKDLDDLKQRLDRIYIGMTYDKEPMTAGSIQVSGAMALLLRDAIKPNLVQTLEGAPALVHTGPFANIAHGCSSLLATRMALAFADYAVTEAGFGFDLGAEKFFDIKCVYGGLCTNLVVLVATCRALKMHGGVGRKELDEANPDAVAAGLPNLDKHLENIRRFGVPAVVCLNRFATDSDEELKVVLDHCDGLGVPAAVGDGFASGGDGMRDLAEMVVDRTSSCKSDFRPLYDWSWPVEKKIFTVASQIYGAEHADYTSTAQKDLEMIRRFGYDKLPVCIAKTQKSLSDNPELLGRPKDFVITVREVEIAAGAGFLIPITGEIMRMPGLPRNPNAVDVDVDSEGNAINLF
ncbi:formate--tetrahydrofolate ligase [Candidatus Fermentibacterales bacterium]|nr:formate--tetrahydrofolate ligase [Candidatus Fermentibacterales bacterium]